jgi:hypothetical protein
LIDVVNEFNVGLNEASIRARTDKRASRTFRSHFVTLFGFHYGFSLPKEEADGSASAITLDSTESQLAKRVKVISDIEDASSSLILKDLVLGNVEYCVIMSKQGGSHLKREMCLERRVS